ncbi:MAG: AAA family ATPase [Clostridia bacterium]|nr:AAA family ATPase [Clostridia bacterium]
MERKFYQTLKEWKDNQIEIPLMIIGARQIGKTYLINQFCKENFKEYVYINLDLEEKIKMVFEQTLQPEEIIKNIELYKDIKINVEDTILFFDEIQVSERAITSLKYFCEHALPYKIICAGSLLGVKLNRFRSSFPVGKVLIRNMYPMDFEEFLLALKKDMWVEAIKES